MEREQIMLGADAIVQIPENAFIPEAPFTAFPKISRLFRPVIITEKIDGTNAAVVVSEVAHHYVDKEVVGPGIVINTNGHKMDGWQPVYVYAQSRKRVISPENDNFGFATWVRDHARELAVGLGPGVHFGEWWGAGIQRKYGLDEKRFSLFNVEQWNGEYNDNGTRRPDCCHVVPVLAELEEFDTDAIRSALLVLSTFGSVAAPEFMDPEGIVTYHKHSNSFFKTTIKDDEKGKEQGA
jgi:RNA ligase